MIDESSYSEAVAEELSLSSSAYAEDVVDEVSLTSSAYGEDVAEAINEGVDPPMPVIPDLTVMQLNIGHFNMGYSPNTSVNINSNKSDGYPTSVTNRNYSIQLDRWERLIKGVDGIKADIMGMPEWNTRFGINGGQIVNTVDTGIFSDYNLSVGDSVAGGWWQHTLLCKKNKYVMSNDGDYQLGSLSGENPAYAREAVVTIKGKQVVIAVTHLNWNSSQNAHDSRVNAEIPALVNRYKDSPYVILFGDFNTDGVYGGAKDPTNKTGLAEFEPFITAGFTLANSASRPLLTSPATNSRPDQVSAAGWPLTPFAYLDNIIVKGFTMSNVRVLDTDVFNTPSDPLDIGMITDHCAVVCDLTMIEEGGEA